MCPVDLRSRGRLRVPRPHTSDQVGQDPVLCERRSQERISPRHPPRQLLLPGPGGRRQLQVPGVGLTPGPRVLRGQRRGGDSLTSPAGDGGGQSNLGARSQDDVHYRGRGLPGRGHAAYLQVWLQGPPGEEDQLVQENQLESTNHPELPPSLQERSHDCCRGL